LLDLALLAFLVFSFARISSNIEINKIYEYYTERVASRIIGSFAIYRFAGEDIRKIKKLAL
jgi:DNA replication protein DnaC